MNWHNNSTIPAANFYGAHSGLMLKEIIKSGDWFNVQTMAKPITNPFKGTLQAVYYMQVAKARSASDGISHAPSYATVKV